MLYTYIQLGGGKKCIHAVKGCSHRESEVKLCQQHNSHQKNKPKYASHIDPLQYYTAPKFCLQRLTTCQVCISAAGN